MSNIVPVPNWGGRPPTGVYPTCPPPMMDCLAGLEACYSDVKRMQAFIKQMMIDIINCDPTVIGRGTPIVGVTDGSDAQPGMVGEWQRFVVSTPINQSAGTVGVPYSISMGVLPAGDWDVQSWFYSDFGGITNLDMAFNPLPAGFSDEGYTAMSAGGEWQWFTQTSNIVRASLSVPTLVVLWVSIALGTAANSAFQTSVSARRMR